MSENLRKITSTAVRPQSHGATEEFTELFSKTNFRINKETKIICKIRNSLILFTLSLCDSVANVFFRKIVHLIIICFLLFPLAVQARTIAPLEGLEALRKGFSGMSDFTAEITQEKRLSIMKRNLVSNGTVRFRKPDQFMLEIRSPYESRLLLRDNIIEQAVAHEKEHSRIVLPPEQGLKQWFAKLAGPISSLPEGIGVRSDLSGSLYTLWITPAGKGQVKDLTIVFQKDGVIRRLIIDERNGDRATMNFKKMRRNTGLTEKDFHLE